MARYWVGNGGNWNDTAHWATGSNGTPGASVPDSTQDVYFDQYSITSASQTVTINVAASCNGMDWTGVLNTPTLAGTSTLSVSGSFTLVAGMTITYNGTITFAGATAGKTITTGGKTLLSSVVFNAAGSWTLQDTFTQAFSGTLRSFTVNAGTIDTNNQTLNLNSFNSTGNTTRTITFGTSTVNITDWSATTIVNISGSGLTFSASSANFVISSSRTNNAADSGACNFNGVTLGSLTINDGTMQVALSDNITMTNFTVNMYNRPLSVNGTKTVTGTFTAGGGNSAQRSIIKASTPGTATTISAANTSLTNVIFVGITAAGTASPFTGTDIQDFGGNTNITASAQETRYWVGNGGNWNDTTHWSTGDGGSSGASVPGPNDIANFTSNSFSSNNQQVTFNQMYGGEVTFTSVRSTTIFNFVVSTLPTTRLCGNITADSSSVTYRTTATGTSSVFLSKYSGTMTVTIPISTQLVFQIGETTGGTAGTITLGASFTSTVSVSSGYGFYLNSSVFDMDGYDMTLVSLTVQGTGTPPNRTLTMTNRTITITGTNSNSPTVWNVGTTTNFTFNSSGSTIVLNANSTASQTFTGGNAIYNNFTISTQNTGTCIIQGSNTFNGTFSTTTTQRIIVFTASTTQTINTFNVVGSNGNFHQIRSSTTTNATISVTNTATADYIYVIYNTATGAASPIKNLNGRQGISVTGWQFSYSPGAFFAQINV